MDSDMKKLVEKLKGDREAWGALCKALASDAGFARDLTRSLSEAVTDGCQLIASEEKGR